MTEPPYECPTRTTGLLTCFRVLLTLATSSACESSPCWLAITSCPSARRVGISLLKQEPSAHRPWTKTMLGLRWFAKGLLLRFVRRGHQFRSDGSPSTHRTF